MYAGHFAAGLAIKAKVPTGTLLFGTGFLDVLFGLFVILGLEKATMTPHVSPGILTRFYRLVAFFDDVAAMGGAFRQCVQKTRVASCRGGSACGVLAFLARPADAPAGPGTLATRTRTYWLMPMASAAGWMVVGRTGIYHRRQRVLRCAVTRRKDFRWARRVGLCSCVPTSFVELAMAFAHGRGFHERATPCQLKSFSGPCPQWSDRRPTGVALQSSSRIFLFYEG